MNITKSNYSQSFGKKALMTCYVKENSDKSKHSATLYKLDPNSGSDRRDLYYSRYASGLLNDFNKAGLNPMTGREFYLLQNDETGEVVSCAETIQRYRPFDSSISGKYTMIEEANQNEKYVNGAEPLLAFITRNAWQKYNASVFTAFNEDTLEGLKRFKFTKVKTGEYYIPERRFTDVVSKAEKKYQMEYLG